MKIKNILIVDNESLNLNSLFNYLIDKNIYSFQFHPELAKTKTDGKIILNNLFTYLETS